MMRRVMRWAEKEVGKSKEAILSRQADNQLPNPTNDVELMSAEQKRAEEHKWIEECGLVLSKEERRRIEEFKWKKARKCKHSNQLLANEAKIPIECSNSYELLEDHAEDLSSPEEEPSTRNEHTSNNLIMLTAAQKKTNKKKRRLQRKMKRLKLSVEKEFFSQNAPKWQKKNKLKKHYKTTKTFGEGQKSSIRNAPTSNQVSRAPAEKLAIEHETS